MAVAVLGIDHVFITVRDLEDSEAYYDALMGVLGFRKETTEIAGERHIHYYNRQLGLWLRPARSDGEHDPYAPGLHHLCFRVEDRETVDEAARGLSAAGIDAPRPRLHPEYSHDYYAFFLADPDGVRLEVRSLGEWRRRQLEAWETEEATAS